MRRLLLFFTSCSSPAVEVNLRDIHPSLPPSLPSFLPPLPRHGAVEQPFSRGGLTSRKTRQQQQQQQLQPLMPQGGGGEEIGMDGGMDGEEGGREGGREGRRGKRRMSGRDCLCKKQRKEGGREGGREGRQHHLLTHQTKTQALPPIPPSVVSPLPPTRLLLPLLGTALLLLLLLMVGVRFTMMVLRPRTL